MPHVTVYLPEDLAKAAKEAGLNLSNLTQEAIRSSLAARKLERWQKQVSELPSLGIGHAKVLDAVKSAKDDLESGLKAGHQCVGDGRLPGWLAVCSRCGWPHRRRRHRCHGTSPVPAPPLLPPLLEGAWARHHNVRLVDALYIELGSQLGATIITTDSGMSAASPNVELVG